MDEAQLRQRDMEAAAKLVIAADAADNAELGARATSFLHEELPVQEMTSQSHVQHQSTLQAHSNQDNHVKDGADRSNVTAVIQREVAPSPSDTMDLESSAQPIPLAHASPVPNETLTISTETLEQRVELMTEMLIDVQRHCESFASQQQNNSPSHHPSEAVRYPYSAQSEPTSVVECLPQDPPSPSRSEQQEPKSLGVGVQNKLDANSLMRAEDIGAYVQERLTPVLARRKASIKDCLGSWTPVKGADAWEVDTKLPIKLFARRSSGTSESRHQKAEARDAPNTTEASEKLFSSSVEKTMREVLGSIQTSPQASPPDDTVFTEAVAQEMKARTTMLPTEPIATAHLVTEQESHEYILQKLDAVAASLQKSVVETKQTAPLTDEDDTHDNGTSSYLLLGKIPVFISCIAILLELLSA